MRKLVLAAMLATLGLGLQPATAGLIGMPLNLLAAVEHIGAGEPAMAVSPSGACGWTDDVWSGPVRVHLC